MSGWRLEHTYAALPALFHRRVQPTPVRDPQFVVFNPALATQLGLDPAALDTPAGAAILAGNALPEGAQPLAQAYAGHQFGHFTTLGDGRAILLGEQVTPGGGRVDVQLKGAGRTPYSRGGDGRAALGPMLRELVISEAMHALGVPTTRSLAVVATGDLVYREEALPGAVLTRIAASHIRVGTFEWAAAHRDAGALRALADYTIQRHHPEVAGGANPYLALFDAVAERQARLLAQWQLVGFIHGVMNTDNMALSGETIDYGPCAFMDAYDPATVFSSIDTQGRYAYANQPPIAQWNLARLAEALLPLIAPELPEAVALANDAIGRFETRFQHHWLAGMRDKLGLASDEPEDLELATTLLARMHAAGADYTNTFRALTAAQSIQAGLTGASVDAPALDPALAADAGFQAWHAQWQARLARQVQSPADVAAQMRRSNPALIPRNHKVEEALEAAVERADLAPLERLLAAVGAPFGDATGDRAAFTAPAAAGGAPYRTFCGT